MDIPSIIFGIIIGLVTYRVFWTLLGLGYIGLYIIEVEKHALMMLATATEAVSYILQIKYNTMKDLELPEKTIEMTIKVDEDNFRRWKETTIRHLISAYPAKFENLVKYTNWDEAMKVLDKIYKKRKS